MCARAGEGRENKLHKKVAPSRSSDHKPCASRALTSTAAMRGGVCAKATAHGRKVVVTGLHTIVTAQRRRHSRR